MIPQDANDIGDEIQSSCVYDILQTLNSTIVFYVS